MSFLVTRPPRPVPETWFTSTPCSEAILATTEIYTVLHTLSLHDALPFSPPLEKAFIPQVEGVAAGIRELAEY